MKATITFLLGVITSVCFSGCSLFVSSGGKHIERVFVSTATVKTIRKELGQPTSQFSYPKPLPASEIPELVALAKHHGSEFFTTPIGTHENDAYKGSVYEDWREITLTTPIESHEDYAYKGWVYEYCSEEFVMFDTVTLGVGELYLFPLSVYSAVQSSLQTHRYRVWYRTDGSCFAHVKLVPQKKESE